MQLNLNKETVQLIEEFKKSFKKKRTFKKKSLHTKEICFNIKLLFPCCLQVHMFEPHQIIHYHIHELWSNGKAKLTGIQDLLRRLLMSLRSKVTILSPSLLVI